MALTVRPVKLPPDLVSASNGRLAPEQLVSIDFAGRPAGGQLHLQAARAWWALVHACLAATGVLLTVTSIADAYRRYEIQLSAFLTRYEPVSLAVYAVTPSSKRKKFSYNGKTYWRLRKGMAPSATPGTSNHGWGLALDICELLGNGSVRGIASSPAWAWLKSNLLAFGFSWEWASESEEPWHVRLFLAEQTTQAVLDFEHVEPSSPLPPFIPEQGLFGLWPLGVKPRLGSGSQGDVVKYLQGVIFFKAGGDIQVNGVYDAQTVHRVSQLQDFFGLTVDGWVGPQTWKLIDTLAVDGFK